MTDPWRRIATWQVQRPAKPELVPGLPAENMRRLRIYWEKLIAWKLCAAERRMHGIPTA